MDIDPGEAPSITFAKVCKHTFAGSRLFSTTFFYKMKTGLTEAEPDERVKEIIRKLIRYIASRATTNGTVLAQHNRKQTVHTDDIVTGLKYETIYGAGRLAESIIERYNQGTEDDMTAEERYFAQNATVTNSTFEGGYSLPIITEESLILPYYITPPQCVCSFCNKVRNDLPTAWESWESSVNDEHSISFKLKELIRKYYES